MGASIIKPDGSTFRFDGVIRITYTPTSVTTDHAIENGSTTSDHTHELPLMVNMEVIVSESPFSNVSTTGGKARLQAAVAFLKSCAKVLVSIVDDTLGTAENCQLLRYPHTVDEVRRLQFPLEFKQVKVATAGFVSIPPEQPVASARAGFPDEQDQGNQPTSESGSGAVVKGVTEGAAQEEADKSILLEILESIGAL